MTKILVVDDEEDLEHLIKNMFRKEINNKIYSMIFARNGKEALDLLETNPDVDVILSDINMPVMDGLELLSILNKRDLLLKSVMISAYGDMSSIRNAMNLGAFDFITKPIDRQDLSITIEKTIQTVQQARSSIEMNNKLRLEKDNAEQSEKFKRQFLANMSHEIRTPMNAVLGFTNILLNRNPREDQIFYLDGIKKSSETLLNIINDILDLSKIEAGKLELESIAFQLKEIFSQVVHLVKRVSAEKDIEVISLINDNISVLKGDPTRLFQILMNLAGNAVKFTNKGSVTLQAEYLEEFSKDDFQTIRFSVIDTGIGIPADKQKTIFEKFDQANISDTRNYGGTGLGLSIAKQLVELHNSQIEVESEEGKGTRFSFSIQFQKGHLHNVQETNQTKKMDGSVLNGLKILVVDDVEYNRIIARDTLEMNSNVSIFLASNGQEAIKLLSENDIDVILMDVQMPEMNGYEATMYIRNNFEKPKADVPILALTAGVMREEVEKCKNAGMNDYIPKPFKTSELIGTIAKNLHLKAEYSDTTTKVIEIEKGASNASGITNLEYLIGFCEGNEDKIKKYVKIFIDSSAPLCEKIEQAIQENDAIFIADLLHGSRTKLNMMGMKDQFEKTFVLEEFCRTNGDITEIKNNLLTFVSEIKLASGELKYFSLQGE
ncbi:MAG: response regulator [Saprospiraceae bacterium]|nr:response regulator [Saprospiraceae bacterium]